MHKRFWCTLRQQCHGQNAWNCSGPRMCNIWWPGCFYSGHVICGGEHPQNFKLLSVLSGEWMPPFLSRSCEQEVCVCVCVCVCLSAPNMLCLV